MIRSDVRMIALASVCALLPARVDSCMTAAAVSQGALVQCTQIVDCCGIVEDI
jgi:hypothetical protein